jgi:hypothetical protein
MLVLDLSADHQKIAHPVDVEFSSNVSVVKSLQCHVHLKIDALSILNCPMMSHQNVYAVASLGKF